MKLSSFYRKRVKNLQSCLREGEAFFLNKKSDVTYFTGFTGEDSYLLVISDTVFFITDGRYTLQLKEELQIDVQEVEIKADKPLRKVLPNLLKENAVQTLLVRGEEISLHFYRALLEEMPNLSLNENTCVEEMRMRKDAYEIEVIKQNLLITELGFHYAVRKIEEVQSELELAAELEYYLKRQGAWKTSFETIIASGKRSALPHGTASDKKIRENELLLMDFGIIKDGYCSDFTRCHYFGKITDAKISELHSLVRDALLLAESKICPGMKASDLDALARNLISDAGYGEFFVHSLGHGVGLDIHEAPRIGAGSDLLLKEGMVFTVEPGIYLPERFGIRLEDMVLVTRTGCEVLTHCEYDL